MTTEQIVDIYNSKISFLDYYQLMFPREPKLTGNVKCKLHNEEHGNSFSYHHSLGIWKCFSGKCGKSGKVVEFHKYYTHLPITKVLDELRAMFPLLDLPIQEQQAREAQPIALPTNFLSKLNQPKPSIQLRVESDFDSFIEDMFFLERSERNDS